MADRTAQKCHWFKAWSLPCKTESHCSGVLSPNWHHNWISIPTFSQANRSRWWGVVRLFDSMGISQLFYFLCCEMSSFTRSKSAQNIKVDKAFSMYTDGGGAQVLCSVLWRQIHIQRHAYSLAMNLPPLWRNGSRVTMAPRWLVGPPWGAMPSEMLSADSVVVPLSTHF